MSLAHYTIKKQDILYSLLVLNNLYKGLNIIIENKGKIKTLDNFLLSQYEMIDDLLGSNFEYDVFCNNKED